MQVGFHTGMRLFLLGFENAQQESAAVSSNGNGIAKFDDVTDDFRAIAARNMLAKILLGRFIVTLASMHRFSPFVRQPVGGVSGFCAWRHRSP